MSSRSQRISAPEAGFSLIEQMVVMSILMVIVTAMMTFFTVFQRTTVRQAGRAQSLGEIRVVLERMTKEVRQLTTVRAGSGASILDMDTYVNGVTKRIRYAAAGTTLSRAVDSGPAITVLERLASIALFTYSPSTDAPTDIEIVLQIDAPGVNGAAGRVSLRSELKLRNRRSG